MLVSATLPPILLEFSRAGLHDPEIIRLDTDSKLSPNLCSTFFLVRPVGMNHSMDVGDDGSKESIKIARWEHGNDFRH